MAAMKLLNAKPGVLADFGFHGAKCSSVVRVFAHDAMGRRIDPAWWTH